MSSTVSLKEGLVGFPAMSLRSKTIAKGLLGFTIISAIVGGIGFAAGGVAGIYWSLGLNIAFTSMVSYFSRELVFWGYGVKQVKAGELVEGIDLHAVFDEAVRLEQSSFSTKPMLGIMKKDVLNAFATGRSPSHSGVAFTTGIIKRAKQYAAQDHCPYTPEQLLTAIALHELGHVKHRDILITAASSVIASIGTSLTSKMYKHAWSNPPKQGHEHRQTSGAEKGSSKRVHSKNKSNQSNAQPSWFTNFAFFFGLHLAVKTLLFITQQMISRVKETRADENAFEHGKGDALKHALIMLKVKVYREHYKNVDQAETDRLVKDFIGHGQALMCVHHADGPVDAATDKSSGSLLTWYSQLKASHPPIRDRVAHLDKLASEKPFRLGM